MVDIYVFAVVVAVVMGETPSLRQCCALLLLSSPAVGWLELQGGRAERIGRCDDIDKNKLRHRIAARE